MRFLRNKFFLVGRDIGWWKEYWLNFWVATILTTTISTFLSTTTIIKSKKNAGNLYRHLCSNLCEFQEKKKKNLVKQNYQPNLTEPNQIFGQLPHAITIKINYNFPSWSKKRPFYIYRWFCCCQYCVFQIEITWKVNIVIFSIPYCFSRHECPTQRALLDKYLSPSNLNYFGFQINYLLWAKWTGEGINFNQLLDLAFMCLGVQ